MMRTFFFGAVSYIFRRRIVSPRHIVFVDIYGIFFFQRNFEYHRNAIIFRALKLAHSVLIESIGYIPEYSGKYVFPGNSWKKSLKPGLIEFNYFVNFIFAWQKVEKSKNMWSHLSPITPAPLLNTLNEQHSKQTGLSLKQRQWRSFQRLPLIVLIDSFVLVLTTMVVRLYMRAFGLFFLEIPGL